MKTHSLNSPYFFLDMNAVVLMSVFRFSDGRGRVVDPLAVNAELVFVVPVLQVHDGDEVFVGLDHRKLGPVVEGS